MAGPTTPLSQLVQADKHRLPGETFEDASNRLAASMADSAEHEAALMDIYHDQRFLPAGRIQRDMGSPYGTTAFNCFVSRPIPDSMEGIMDAAKEAALTMKMGGGIGYDFSPIRPRNSNIEGLGSPASGPVSFMEIFDATCKTISSAGNRRGAQMAVLRVDHPDIEEFIEAKQNGHRFTQFNVSVAVTDEFMEAVKADTDFDLRFEGKVIRTVRARDLWEKIMRATWDWAEPGVLFIDRINQLNNLWYCEKIAATNPCGEQPLPPHGACLLGSINLVKYLFQIEIPIPTADGGEEIKYAWDFDLDLLIADIPHIVRAMDNVIDRTSFPLPEQEREAKDKRRMGIGLTGVANAVEALGAPYGSPEAQELIADIMRLVTNECYCASSDLAAEKGSFPLYQPSLYLQGRFIQTLDKETWRRIHKFGIRNSHLTSIAPTGSISLAADNVSGGIEPVFSEGYTRKVTQPDGSYALYEVQDYGVAKLGVTPKAASEVTLDEHLGMQAAVQRWVDSSVSKTVNLSGDETWEQFQNVYLAAYEIGCKGVTTFNPKGKRMALLEATPKTEAPDPHEDEGGACYIDLETGQKACS